MSFKRAAQFTALTVLPAMLILLAACVTIPPMEGEPDQAPEQEATNENALNNDEGIVFGIVTANYYNAQGKRVLATAAPEIKYELSYGTARNIGMKRVFSGFHESISTSTKEPNTFFMLKLPEGEYTFFKLNRPFPGTIGTVASDVRFTVAPKKATYIGVLEVDFRSGRGIFGEERPAEKVGFKVTGDPEKATEMYKERNRNLSYPVETNLMKVIKIK